MPSGFQRQWRGVVRDPSALLTADGGVCQITGVFHREPVPHRAAVLQRLAYLKNRSKQQIGQPEFSYYSLWYNRC